MRMPASGDVEARLSFVVPAYGQRPFSYVSEPPPGVPWEGASYEQHRLQISDARSTRPSIDREGFELQPSHSGIADFMDEAAVREVHYPEIAELVLRATGAEQAFVFDHLLRRREAARGPLDFGRKDGRGVASANGRVHNDYTESSGRRRLGLVLGDALPAAQGRRHAIVNVWRSIGGPVVDTPLALCDARTVATADLVDSEVRYPHRTGEIYQGRFSQAHRWSYFSRMDRDEALVFKQYDSQTQGVSRFVLHAAFDHPGMPEGAPLRESIEARCLVLY